MAVVYLPLQGRFAKRKDLQADEYESFVNEFCSPADFIYTFLFRYAGVIQRDLYTRFGDQRSTNGVMMDFTNANPWAAFVTTACVLAACIASVVSEYETLRKKEQEEEDEINDSYSAILPQLLSPRKKRRLPNAPQPTVDELNQYLADVLNDNPELKNKYNSVRIAPGTEYTSPQLVFDKKDKVETPFQRSVSQFFGPAWSALGISTFTYWILYIGSGVFGDFGNFGASGLPGFGFGLSILSGLAYLGINAYNKYQYNADRKLGIPELADPETARDGILLLKECQLRRELDLTKKQLQDTFGVTIAEQKDHKSYQALINQPAVKKSDSVGLVWLGALVGSYISMQYIAWLSVDIAFRAAKVALPAIEIVNFVGGIGLFVVAGIYSAYKASKAYEKSAAIEAPAIPEKTPAQLYQQRKELIAQLKLNLIGKQYSGQVIDEKILSIASPAEITIPEKCHPPVKNQNKETAKLALKFLWKFALNFMSGATLARFFLLKGSATLLPFAAAAFSNPITIGLVIGIGVAWGAIKLYQEYQSFKAEQEKIAQLEQQKLNSEYVHNIELADLQISALQELQKKVTTPAITATVADTAEPQSPGKEPGLRIFDQPTVVSSQDQRFGYSAAPTSVPATASVRV